MPYKEELQTNGEVWYSQEEEHIRTLFPNGEVWDYQDGQHVRTTYPNGREVWFFYKNEWGTVEDES